MVDRAKTAFARRPNLKYLLLLQLDPRLHWNDQVKWPLDPGTLVIDLSPFARTNEFIDATGRSGIVRNDRSIQNPRIVTNDN